MRLAAGALLASMIVACSAPAPTTNRDAGAADADATCERAIAAWLALHDHQPRSASATLTADARHDSMTSGIAACKRDDWDAVKRRCMIAAADLSALADCFEAADRRRHPEWNWRL